MSARIVLERPHAHFTNLDNLAGKVILQLNNDTAISAINVKLEGESRTRLTGPRSERSEKKKTELEVHKILYQKSTVFPSPDIAQHSSPDAVFTLAPGVHEYPFRFKIPFNNACSYRNSVMTNLYMVGLRVEVARDPVVHVKQTLPPSLSAFPQVADIRYYVKATVVRPEFYKENIRAITGFTFLPIEPPRISNPNEEVYARRKQEFRPRVAMPTKRKGSLFRKAQPLPPPISTDPPCQFSVDARLPNPPILTRNQPIPLRLIVTKMSPTTQIAWLQMLQIELISYTRIRAHEFVRTEPSSTVILSLSNMNVPLGKPNDSVGQDWIIDSSLWKNLPVPPAVAPSFETCNISRHYELEVRVGLAPGSPGGGGPQMGMMVLPLRLAVKVYSGIAPPPELLAAIDAGRRARQQNATRPETAKFDVHNDEQPPPTPERPPRDPNSALAPALEIAELEAPTDAPPSYEDAIADQFAPIEGPRHAFNGAAVSPQSSHASAAGDIKTPVDSASQCTKNDNDPPPRTPSRSSEESIDMLPQTPGSRPESLVDSLIEEDPPASMSDAGRQASTTAQTQPEELIVHGGQSSHATSNPSRSPRPFNTGVPRRRPVPGQSDDPSHS